jgi:putative SOS response-associated peptidase YedK
MWPRPIRCQWSVTMPRPENAASTCCGGAWCRIGPRISRWSANINAKADGIENRPAFREAFQRRRCLVQVDNFYKKTATGKQPYAIALADRGLMALAGVSENWRSPAGEWVRSFAIVTTTPNELCAGLHNRMPVVLGPGTWAGLARRRGRRCTPAEGPPRALSIGKDGRLARQSARRQR